MCLKYFRRNNILAIENGCIFTVWHRYIAFISHFDSLMFATKGNILYLYELRIRLYPVMHNTFEKPLWRLMIYQRQLIWWRIDLEECMVPQIEFNHRRAGYIFENMNIILHFLSLFITETAHVIARTFPRWKQWSVYSPLSTPLLLMAWRRVGPGRHLPWYWPPCFPGILISAPNILLKFLTSKAYI